MVSYTTTVGIHGEILLNKVLRLAAGIQPGDTVQLEARKGQLIVRKVFSISEILARKPAAKISPDNLERELEEEGRLNEKMAD